MSIIVHNVISAATNINFNYLESEHLFGLDVEGTYTLSIDDLEYEEGEVVFNGQEAFTALRKIYHNQQLVAKIGTDIYRQGIISRLERQQENTVNSNTVVISIRERQKAVAGNSFTFINESVPKPEKVSSFSETFSFSRQGNTTSYNRNISLQYDQDVGDQFLDDAYIFIKNIYYRNRPSLGYQNDGLSEKNRFDNNFRPRISESYDLINKTVALSENLVASRIEGNYSKAITYSVNNTSEGFKEKQYNISVVGLKSPLSHEALNGIKTTIDTVCSDNSNEFGNPVSISKTVSKDSNTINATVSFSTDIRKNQTSSTTYTVTKAKNESFFDYTVSIERKRIGPHVRRDFEELKTDWASGQPDPETKVNILFEETNTLTLYEKSRQVTFSPSVPSINEEVVFTTDPAYNSSGDILKQKFTVDVSRPVERIHRFNVPLDKERVQRLFPNTVGTIGTKTVTAEIVKKKTIDIAGIDNDALTLAAQPPDGTYWITEKSSSIDPFNGVITATIGYNFYVS